MRHQTQVALIKRIFDLMEREATDLAPAVETNPVRAYTDPAQLALEQENLFRGLPLLVALSGQIPNPGDYLTETVAGLPVLAVRGDDARVRAFLNVCRHRGAPVAEGCGAKRRFTCPYHGWSYDRDGRLASVPQAHWFDRLDKGSHGLVPLPVEERDGLIWLRAARDGAGLDLDAHLAGVDADFASFGLAGYVPYATRTFRRRMNWKIVIDTFLESYHLPILHRGSVDPIFLSNRLPLDFFGRHWRAILARRSIVELRTRPERDWDILPYTAVIYVLFPNTVFLIQLDHVEIWRVYPVAGDVDHCDVHFTFMVPELPTNAGARRHWRSNWELAIHTVETEDFQLGEKIQRGFHSGAQEVVTYGRHEPALGHFHRTVRREIGLED